MLVKYREGLTYDSVGAMSDALIKDAFYIVAALEYFDDRIKIYVNPGSVNGSYRNEPCAFDIRYFDIVDGSLADDWAIRYFPEFNAYIFSYQEWLSSDYAQHAHDYDLVGDYLKVFLDRMNVYQEGYEDYLAKNQMRQGYSSVKS